MENRAFRFTRLDIITYRLEHGAEAARNLLLLAGPDHYAGDYNETMATLEAAIISEGGRP